MEYYDEDKPRIVFQTRRRPTTEDEDNSPKVPNKIFITISVIISLVTLSLSFFYFESEPSKSLFLWLSLSFLVGPFAPPSITGGKIRVGHGPILEPEQIHEEIPTDNETRRNKRSNKTTTLKNDNNPTVVMKAESNRSVKEIKTKDKEWSEEEIEILKKQLVKHPAGKPGRWEVIGSAFGGKYETENVIKKAKEIGEKRVYESDDYALFLKNRKKGSGSGLVDEEGEEEGEKSGVWSNGEDIALLNALKAFPKEVSMRWEKIAAAVPGKTKGACMKRVTELKKGFRSSKSGGN